jgi:RNA polymerase sigma-70 factor (ECF subfamily)
MEQLAVGNPVTTIDETMLVARAKRDRNAFAPLYIAYFDRVYAYCYRRLGNPDEAADATSAVFSRVLESLASCRDASFRSWLFAIAHNTLTDLHRARRFAHSLDDTLQLRDRGPSPEDEAIAHETTRTVAALLSQLPTDQRNVLELRLTGLTSKEIGAILGKQPNAVDQAQHRAVSRLRMLTANPDAVTERHR